MNKIVISDHTLRDGNHAVSHKITVAQIEKYCQFAESANIPIVEVGIKVEARALFYGLDRLVLSSGLGLVVYL